MRAIGLVGILVLALASDIAIAASWPNHGIGGKRKNLIPAKWFTDYPAPTIANPTTDPCVAAVGRLTIGRYNVGTAELVLNRREVLTSTIVASQDRVVFRLGYIRRTWSLATWGTVVARGSAYVDQYKNMHNLASGDWAIIVLDKGARATVNPMDIYPGSAISSTNLASFLAIVGYPVGFPQAKVPTTEVPIIAAGCDIAGVDANHLLLHTCGADHGSSGGPIFMRLDDGSCQVVGIQILVNPEGALYAPYKREIANGAVPAESFRWAALKVQQLLEAGETADQIKAEYGKKW